MSIPAILTSGLSAIYERGPFAEDAVYFPKTGASKKVRVIFTSPYQASQGLGVEIGDAKPSCRIRASDTPAITRGERLKIRDTDYFVMERMPTGDGEIICSLSEET
jgi:hypothetical protein